MTNQINQKEIENKWQKIWKEEKTFEPKIDFTKEKYFATVPYPYANSIMHIGHGRAYTTPDIFARFQRLLGKNVLFPLAYHISGTPVLAVSDAIKKGDKKQIELTKAAISEYIEDKKEVEKILESFKDPFEIAKFFSSTIEGSLDSVGISIDWSRQFSTGDETYQKFVEWQFKKLEQTGILTQGKYPILYSVEDANAVGEDDIKDGDTDKVSLSEMKYIKFQIKESDEFLVAATLRPDSLFGATNLYVKPNMELVKLKVGDDVWIVSKKSKVKIEHQFENVELISEHLGKEFLESEVIVPIINKKVPVYPMDYPDENHGTGIVYSSPADSPHDYIYLFELKFPGKSLNEFKEDPLKLTTITKTKDKKGNIIEYKSNIPAFDKLLKFGIYNVKDNFEKLEIAKEELYKEAHYGAVMINCNDYDNTPLRNNIAANKVKEELEKSRLGGTFYETSRRAVTRGGDDVIVANLDGQWFLNYSTDEIKEKAYSLLESMSFNPTKLRETQKGYLKWVEMRPCARKRGIGTPLPMDKDWVIESLSDSTIYQMLYLVHGIINREKICADQLTHNLFEYVFLEQGNIKLISEESNISEKIINEMRESVEYWKSFDLRYTAGAHMSNHLSFLIYHYALIFPQNLQPKNITIGGMLIRDGHKISKSKGNGLPLVRVGKEYGADLYRLYVAVGANYDIEMDFRDEEIIQLEKKFNKWKSLVNESINRKNRDYSSFSNTNKWLISKFYSRVNEYMTHMSNFRLREAFVQILYEFLNDISYHERRCSYEETLDVIRFIVKDYIKLMMPAVPHFCEEAWGLLGEKSRVSLEVFSTDINKYISKDAEDYENIAYNLIANITRQKENKGIKDIKKLIIIQASASRFDLFDKIKELLSRTKNIKEIFGELNKEFSYEKKFISKFVPKTLGSGISFYLSKEDEKKYLESLIEYISQEFNCLVEIKSNDNLENKLNIIPSEFGLIFE